MRDVPPPSSPAAVIPHIPEVPEAAPLQGTGRLLIVSEDEPSTVARVIETSEGTVDQGPGWRQQEAGTPMVFRKLELLCMAPCAADLRVGAHSLVFTSTRDPERTSTIDVRVPQGTTVVRHALGTDKPYGVPYVVGILSAFGGGVVTLAGGTAMAIGLGARSTTDTSGNETSPQGVAVFGAVLGTVGLAALVTGIVLLANNRPAKGPGATTTFRVP